MTGIKNVCIKNFGQYSCIVVVLLSTMNDRDKEYVHEECCSIHDLLILIFHFNISLF